MTTTGFGAPADSLAGNFTLGSAYAGYPASTPIPIETLLSNVFTKGADPADQYDPAALGTMAKYDGTNPGWAWRYTKMYMDLEHEVAPAAQALGCSACHNASSNTAPTQFFIDVGYDCNPRYGTCARTP